MSPKPFLLAATAALIALTPALAQEQAAQFSGGDIPKSFTPPETGRDYVKREAMTLMTPLLPCPIKDLLDLTVIPSIPALS